MSRVDVEIEEVELEIDGEPGRTRPGVRATCTRCDETTESYGTGPSSRIRCILLMKEGCPNNEENYYVDPDAGEAGSGRPADPVPKKWWEK